MTKRKLRSSTIRNSNSNNNTSSRTANSSTPTPNINVNKRMKIPYHLVTPEEPKNPSLLPHLSANQSLVASMAPFTTTNTTTPAGNELVVSPSTKAFNNNFFKPSIQDTRNLELSILEMLKQLNDKGNKEIDKTQIVDLLNRSLTTISHWSLQAQLAVLKKNDSTGTYGKLLESHTNGKCKETRHLRNNTHQKNFTTSKLALRSINDNLLIVNKSPVSKNEVTHNIIPKKAITTMKNEFSTPRDPTTSTSDSNAPFSFKLVENNKPHPRMRRTGDNPSANSCVRVFHLEKTFDQ